MSEPSLTPTMTPPTAAEQRKAVIELEGVYFAYPGRLVLSAIDLRIHEGEFVAVIGPSGCGKSTLLMMIAGLLAPARGEIRTMGAPVHGPGPDRAVVFQNFALLPWKTAFENVRLGMRYQRNGMSKDEIEAAANHYLELVGLRGFERSFPHQLSGGMQQRVGLARAFAARSSILLMDEPFAAIDAQNAEILREELRDLVRTESRTVLFVTHNLDEALFLADRIVVLETRPGRVREDIVIDLPQPRGLNVDDEEQRLRYADYRARLWEHLRGEVERERALAAAQRMEEPA